MIIKKANHRNVEFYAASPRLALAYRSAARHNKSLSRSGIQSLVDAGESQKPARHRNDFEMVVLSHVDDDLHALTAARWETVVAKAFHLLFTEPTTHPDQVAQWMRTTNIRSENRLHVIQVKDLEAPQVSQLLGRVCFALGRDSSRGSIIDAYLAGNTLLVRGPMHRMLHVPVSAIPALNGQPRNMLRNFAIDPDGSFIYWPDLDVHLGWKQFLQAVDPGELRKAQQRSAGFNKRYGTAIRKVREAAGILQSQVEGLTERQLRRIEHGECRATTAALVALANAHGIGENEYLEKLAAGTPKIQKILKR